MQCKMHFQMMQNMKGNEFWDASVQNSLNALEPAHHL